MATLCRPEKPFLTKYNKTKFKPSEIRNFYQYFKKFSSDGDSINLIQFKKSLGILGYNKNNFICKRLFDLIDKENNGKVIIN